MKFNKMLVLLLLTALVLAGCTKPDARPDTKMQKQIEKRCAEIVSMYQDLYSAAGKMEPESKWEEPDLTQSSIDAIEERLQKVGLDVVDTDEICPGYLTTGENFYSFWTAVQQNQDARQEVITIRPSGALGYQLFTYQSGTACVYSMVDFLDDSMDSDYEVHEILDWDVTENGNFYYRICPAGDKHFADYTLIRLEKPEKELWELNQKYIMAGGYVATNLYLTDWTEENLTGLSFNDLWEYLYRYENGEQFSPKGYTYSDELRCYQIPAEEFEQLILPYFNMDTQTLRSLAQYHVDGDFYPWHQIETNEYAFYLSYYTIDPEVTAYLVNPDGTITIRVQMISTDLKTDCLFSHEVTVRPLENGGFQFVGNQVIDRGAYGLPFCEPRLTWEKAG